MINEPIDPTILAYCAGLFDGEGCICVHRRKPRADAPTRGQRSMYYRLELKVKMVHKPTIDFLHDVFGVGIVAPEQPGKNNKRVSWKWIVCQVDSVMVLQALLPYLRQKQAEAEVAIEFAHANRRRAFGHHSLAPEILVEREAFYQRLRDLKTFEWDRAAGPPPGIPGRKVHVR